jgi:histidine phosphotransferase ChpT
MNPLPQNPLAQSDEPPHEPISGVQLAAQLAARLCHDFMSPAGAIVSGLDLLDDPTAQDMREEALTMIAASARKLLALLTFDRVAFGGSSAAENFDARELERLTREHFSHGRSTLDWSVGPESLAKPAARVTMNLALIGAGALPIGGVAAINVTASDDGLVARVHATGARARLRPEVIDGLNGVPLNEGLSGHWVQAYFLRSLIDAEGGSLEIETGEGEVTVRVRLPH